MKRFKKVMLATPSVVENLAVHEKAECLYKTQTIFIDNPFLTSEIGQFFVELSRIGVNGVWSKFQKLEVVYTEQGMNRKLNHG